MVNKFRAIYRKIKNKIRNKIDTRYLYKMSDSDFVDMSYLILFRREPDKEGKQYHLEKLKNLETDRDQLLATLINSPEFAENRPRGFGESIHHSRIQWVRSLPKAEVIVDLGGSAKGDHRGALVLMGYPYTFKQLYIIDLPLDERIKLYSDGYEIYDKYQTDNGPIEYVYSSMTNLSSFTDSSVDFVNSGQSIEHITEADADIVLRECLRILRPGGHLCIDTPNGESTRLQQTEFVDPDHKVEYCHDTLLSKIKTAGFVEIQSFGMNYMPNAHDTKKFRIEEPTNNSGVFSDSQRCYILAYRCRKPYNF
jgi:SAM-dependent methyltransferase